MKQAIIGTVIGFIGFWFMESKVPWIAYSGIVVMFVGLAIVLDWSRKLYKNKINR